MMIMRGVEHGMPLTFWPLHLSRFTTISIPDLLSHFLLYIAEVSFS
jgi:hypothetical protein